MARLSEVDVGAMTGSPTLLGVRLAANAERVEVLTDPVEPWSYEVVLYGPEVDDEAVARAERYIDERRMMGTIVSVRRAA